VPHRSRLIQPVNLPLANLPASLDGLRIAHLTDLHITRPRRRLNRIRALLGNLRVDLVVFTGDYITHVDDVDAGVAVMAQLCQSVKPRLAMFGVFGNHDTPELRKRLAKLPVHWLNNQTHRFEDLPLEISGFEADTIAMPDSVATLFDFESGNGGAPPGAVVSGDPPPRPVRLLLSHFPHYLPVAADLGVDVMIAGHTHGGQMRLPGARAIYNSADLPRHLTSGILRHRDTLGVISRGLGESRFPLRLFCPPHLPIYTLRNGTPPGKYTDHIELLERW